MPRRRARSRRNSRRVEAAQRGRHERHERAPSRRPSVTSSGSKPGSDLEGGAGDQRPGHDREAADVGERQAREPAVAAGVDAEPARWWPTPTPATDVVGEHDAFGRAGRAAGRRPPGRRRPRPGARLRAAVARRARPMSRAGRHRLEQRLTGRAAQARVEGEHRVAVIPDAPQSLDEAGAGTASATSSGMRSNLSGGAMLRPR